MKISKQPGKISAVIFDMDGTLLNTLNDIAVSMNTVLVRNGLPPHPIEKYRIFIGKGIAALAKRALEQNDNSDVSVSDIVQQLHKEYEKRLFETTDYYEGIPDVFDVLSNKNIPMAILSNKRDYLTQKLSNFFFKYWNFELIYGALDNFPKKPDPALALHMLTKMNIPPEECIFVGDTPADMLTAINGGMFPVGVLWGFRNKEILLDAGAKIVCGHPREVGELICQE